MPHRPTEAECLCKLCGYQVVIPSLWLDDRPPGGSCPHKAETVTECAWAMGRGQMVAAMLRAKGYPE